MRLAAVASSAFTMLAAGCPERTIAAVDLDQSKEEKLVVPVHPKNDVDVLFVVDDSGSMLAEQTSVRANFPRFIQKLEEVEGATPNMHIGVVSTNMGAGGFTTDSRCGGGGDGGRLRNASPALMGTFIRDVDDPASDDPNVRLRNYTGALADVFSDIAALGTEGCGFEQQLAAMKAALDGSVGENAGFLRGDEAYLAVVFLTDEDDCSARDPRVFDTSDASLGWQGMRCTEYGVRCDGHDLPRVPASYELCEPRTDSFLEDPAFYASWLRGLKSAPRDVFVASISGDVTPFAIVEKTDPSGNQVVELGKSCGEIPGDRTTGAIPSVRMNAFLDGFPDRATFRSICETDLGPALDQIGEQLKIVLGAPCFAGRVDTTDLSPDLPGLQLECQVSDVIDPDSDTQEETVLPRCSMASDTTVAADSPIPCWWAGIDLERCAMTETGLTIHVERGGDLAPAGTYMVARCLTE
jgi:hypothetical protein